MLGGLSGPSKTVAAGVVDAFTAGWFGLCALATHP